MLADREVDKLTSCVDDPLVPLHLLIWSVETAMSTLTCTVEAMSWEGFTKEEKIALAQLYVPYLVLGRLSSLAALSSVKQA
jgi:hypothetical protein